MAREPHAGLKLVRGAGPRALVPELIRALREREDPFERPLVCLPNREVQAYVTSRVAEALGVCMNLELTSVDRALLHVARACGGEATLWTAPALARVILLAFAAEREAGGPTWEAIAPLLEPVAPTADGLAHAALAEPSAAARERRAYRLASHLARLFLSYTWTHPTLLERWERGDDDDGDELSRWQSAIWRRVSLLARESGAPRATHAELLRRLPDEVPDVVRRTRVLVFGYAYLGPFERQALCALAERVSVEVFLDTVLRDDERGEGVSAPLRRWAEAAAVTDDELQRAAAEVRTVSAPSSTNDALRRARSRLVGLEAELRPGELDGVVSVVGAPGARREAEVIAERLWDRLLTSDDTLGDVAVCSARYEEQIPWLEDRFAALHGLPSSTPHGGRASRMLDVAVELLELPERGARRDAVLAVLTHECFRGRGEGDDVSGLVAAAGIYLGLDDDDPELRYLDGAPRFHWEQGLARLQVSTFLDGSATFTRKGQPLSSLELPHARERASRVHAWASSLLADLHTLSSWSLSGAMWARVLEDVVRTYLAPRSEEDGRHWAALLNAIRTLADVDVVVPRAPGGAATAHLDEPPPLPYAVALEMVRDQLGTQGGARGQFLTNGVAISRLVKNRAVPFRTVVVSGLGEGVLPSRETIDPLDVRSAPDAGVPPVEVTGRQLQELAFAQAVTSAEQRLILTWTNRDPARDAPLAPSPLIEELCDALGVVVVESAALSAHEDAARHDRHARLRTEALHLRHLVDDAVEQATGAPPSYLPSLPLWQEALDEPARARAGIEPPPEAPAVDERVAPRRLDSWSFIGLLKDPVEAFAKRLGLSTWDTRSDDDALVETEPFGVEKAVVWHMCRAVLRRLFAEHPTSPPSDDVIDAAARDEVEARQAIGALPHGALLPPDATALVSARARAIVRGLDELEAYRRGYDGIVALGPNRAPGPGRRSCSPLVLDVDGARVEVTHERGLLFGPRDDRLLLELSGKAGSSANDDPDFRQRVEMLLFLLAGEIAEGANVRAVCVSGEGKLMGVDYRVPSEAEARAYLAGLVRAMRDRSQLRALPLEALGDVAQLVSLARTPELVDERKAAYALVRDTIARTWRHREEEPANAQYTALRSRDGFAPPSEAELFAMVHARFAPLVDMRRDS